MTPTQRILQAAIIFGLADNTIACGAAKEKSLNGDEQREVEEKQEKMLSEEEATNKEKAVVEIQKQV